MKIMCQNLYDMLLKKLCMPSKKSKTTSSTIGLKIDDKAQYCKKSVDTQQLRLGLLRNFRKV